MTDPTAILKGIPTWPVVNVRRGPGLTHDIFVTLKKGTADLMIIGVEPDVNGDSFEGKVHQWINIQLEDSSTGWVRDDVTEIYGDLTPFGYPDTPAPALAFSLTLDETPLDDEAMTTADRMRMRGPMGTDLEAPPPLEETGLEAGAPAPAAEARIAPCTALISGIAALSYVKVRERATTASAELFRMDKGTGGLTVLDAAADERGEQSGGKTYQWFKLRFPNGRDGWVRDDLLSIQGDCTAAGYGVIGRAVVASTLTRRSVVINGGGDRQPTAGSASGFFPQPVAGGIQTGNFGDGHLGWDIGPANKTIYSAPAVGTVVRAHNCTRCTASQPSAYRANLSQQEKDAIFFDAAWGWGFGNHVIIRYTNSVLSTEIRQKLSGMGRGGQHLFVMYAHMKEVNVKLNQQLDTSTAIGTVGNTGFSTGPHLHLEIKAGSQTSFGGWAGLGDSLNPNIAFSMSRGPL